jgi:hypothetical protein
MRKLIVISSDRAKCEGGDQGTIKWPNAEAEWKGRIRSGELWVYDRYAPVLGYVIDATDPGNWRMLGSAGQSLLAKDMPQ